LDNVDSKIFRTTGWNRLLLEGRSGRSLGLSEGGGGLVGKRITVVDRIAVFE
jgi:hypothetical protein